MFSAYDSQTGEYFHTGKNTDTKEECEKDICKYLLDGGALDYEYTPEERKGLESNPEEVFEMYQVEIHEHKEKINEREY